MENLANIISELKEYNDIIKSLQKNESPVLVCGISGVHKANIVSNINLETNKQCLIITANDSVSQRMAKDVEEFTLKKPLVLSMKEFVFHNILSSSREQERKRISSLSKIKSHKGVIIATIDSIMQATIPPKVLENSAFEIKSGEEYKINALLEKLVSLGYTRCMQIEGESQFSLRGGILDIFPVSYAHPIRIEFFDDEVDTISYFDVQTQRRTTSVESFKILPVSEVLPHFSDDGVSGLIEKLEQKLSGKLTEEQKFNVNSDIEKLKNLSTFPTIDRYTPMVYDRIYTILDYLHDDAFVFFDDLNRVNEQADIYYKRFYEDFVSLCERGILLPENKEFLVDFIHLSKKMKNIVVLDTFLQKNHNVLPKSIINITTKQLPAYSANTELAKNDIEYYHQMGYKVIILCKGDVKAKALAGILQPLPVKITQTPKYDINIIDGSLSAGFEYPEIKLAVITEGQIFAKKEVKKVRKTNREHVKSYTDLVVGDIVVHEEHGIGKFVGMEKILVDGFERDYVKMAFAGTDTLYVSAGNLNLISKYIGSGGEDKPVRLTKLGGAEWQKTKYKAKSSAKELAKYLIELYAKRLKLEGFPFEKDDVWQEDFEKSFPYEETDDQLRSVAEIKKDMESTVPMDRLLCGDVGFGKTEVALRAVMKCIMSGKQSAILVPTTVLARQHYLTASQRFNGYPVKIEFISRFKTKKEEFAILERLKQGKIDLIIGTHKLFSKEIKFNDLGLLIIDEEQRFGVAHKEKLKQIGENIDVLTLSATPIPRTLNMALSGIRDMSVLEEAPHNRQPVETYVLEYDFGVIIDAIRREMLRNGQCFYLYNFIDSIDIVAGKIARELPEANIAVAHGRMTQKELSNIMSRMNDGEIDVLVSTTIIETGIDISNANTLIIENADRLGLAQLHQIRGRVGRSNRVAYAYLTYQTGKVLSEIASKRLSAIREFAEFGSGFKIAMRDLEIRGAGSVLGERQSGHLANIGYELYLKLLEDAILEEKGEKPVELPECTIDLSIDAHISDKFISDIGQRIDLYRRIAMIKTDEDIEEMQDEIIDRYSDVPKSVSNLCLVAKLRHLAMKNGIINIAQKSDRIQIDFDTPNLEKLSKLCSVYDKRMMLSVGDKSYVTLKMLKGEKPLKLCSEIIENVEKMS